MANKIFTLLLTWLLILGSAGLTEASTLVETVTLADGTVLQCVEESGQRTVGVVQPDQRLSVSELTAKERGLRHTLKRLKKKLKAARTKSAQKKWRRKIAAARTLLNQLTSFKNRCVAAGPTPTPLPPPTQGGTQAIIADHNAVAAYASIPPAVISAISTQFKIYYGHTSHGSQIMTGIQMLPDSASPPILDVFHEPGGDLGHSGNLAWAAATRAWLNAHPDYNLVMWSWCGGVSDNTEQGIDAYLQAMAGLEADYPNVRFVYMTGHLDGSGAQGNLRTMNARIRNFCSHSGKVLFDFEDIESWDPAGNYYPDGSDACEWCSSWCSTHSCPSNGCAHSHPLNCYIKGKAWYWMMAKLAGW